MCGIAGIVGDVTADVVAAGQRMLDQLAHRGPDDHGWLAFSPAELQVGQGRLPKGPVEGLLLHRRLAILDLSEAGRQPMTSADGRYHIVYNGELYNYLELRTELERTGDRFRTDSDTEVLLASFVRWGPDCLTRFLGMFAFGILDTEGRRLFLARDPFGIKPLYFAESPRRFSFASEIGALFELPGITREANPQRLFYYLQYGMTDFGNETLSRHVSQVPPGHYLDLDLDRLRPPEPVQYWRLRPDPTMDLSFGAATARLRELFLESIRLHMRSHVEVGAMLSGGIDSSSNVMGMQRLLGPEQKLHTFSFITEDENRSDETLIDLAASTSSAIVHKARAVPDGLVHDLDGFISAQGEPVGGPSVYSEYLVFRLVREVGIKVVLGGHGADELFAGYDEFLIARLISLLRAWRGLETLAFYRRAVRQPHVRLRHSLSRAASRSAPGWLRRLARGWRFVTHTAPEPLFDSAWFDERGVVSEPPRHTSGIYGRRFVSHDMISHSQLPMQLRYEDRNAMAFGIENRVPFLTRPLVEFVFSLPDNYLISADGTRKHVLRAALRGIVPDAILDRKEKVGFQMPSRDSMLGLRPYVERALSGDAVRQLGFLNVSRLEAEWSEVLAAKRPFDYRVWRWVCLVRWAELTNARFV